MTEQIHHETVYGIETVYVGVAGHLRRFKVVDADGNYVPGGLFRTWAEAERFIVSVLLPRDSGVVAPKDAS